MDIPPEFEKAWPAVAGSLTAVAFLREPWRRLFVLFLAGIPFALIVAPVLTPLLGDRMSGYTTGVFGMVLIAKLFDSIYAFDGKKAGRELWLAFLSRVKRKR